MNWKNRYSILKIGDKIRCVKNPNGRISGENKNEGHGWKENTEFIIDNITGPFEKHGNQKIIWDKTHGGVYEDYVEKIIPRAD